MGIFFLLKGHVIFYEGRMKDDTKQNRGFSSILCFYCDICSDYENMVLDVLHFMTLLSENKIIHETQTSCMVSNMFDS